MNSKDCSISNTHGECSEYSFIVEGHRKHRSHIVYCSHLPVPGQGAATRLLRLEDGRVLVLLVVVGVDVVVGDVDVDHAPLLQLLGVKLVNVLLLAPVADVVSLYHDVEVILEKGKLKV